MGVEEKIQAENVFVVHMVDDGQSPWKIVLTLLLGLFANMLGLAKILLADHQKNV
jgi:hypothetical protein